MDRTVGPFRLGESLGVLPFGELAAAAHTARSGALAILLLDDRLAKDHRFRGLLRLEVARAGGLRHPAVARPLEVGEQAGALYVVFERPADSQTLARVYADGGPPTPDETIALIRRLADGLDAAHARRMVYGALGPSSVLVDRDGNAALVGIGLLAAVDEAGLGAVVAERTEAAFTAPEQRGGKLAVPSADGYALGMLAGALLRVQVARNGAAPLTATGMVDTLGAVLARQCATEPAARYPSCAAFAAALGDALAPAHPIAAEEAPTTQAGRPGTAASRSAPATSGTPPAPPAHVTDRPLPWAPADAVPPESVLPGAAPTAVAGALQPSWRSDDVARRIRDTIDPPRPASSEGPALDAGPGTQHVTPASPATPAAVDVSTLKPTPAMLACLAALDRSDPIGDGVQWLAARVPAVAQLLERACPDGKVGTVPLGVATAGALALLLAAAGQYLFATVVGSLLVVLYVVPRAVAMLSSSERATLEVVKVAGPARIDLRTGGLLGTTSELELGNGMRLSLSESATARLAPFALPITVERPVPGVTGTSTITVGYDFPEIIVTYLASSRLLFDVRDTVGTVLYRRPGYDGEPGDRLWSEQHGGVSGGPTRGAMASMAFTPDAEPRWRRTSRGQSIVLPIPPVTREALQKAVQQAKTQAAVAAGIGFVLLIGSSYTSFGGFALFALLIVFVAAGAGPLTRALTLWNARHASSLVRVIAPVTATQCRHGKGYRYRLRLDDDTELSVGRELFDRLARAADPNAGATWTVNDIGVSDGEAVAEHELPTATATYVPDGPLLLEILGPDGATLYRDRVVREGDIASLAPGA